MTFKKTIQHAFSLVLICSFMIACKSIPPPPSLPLPTTFAPLKKDQNIPQMFAPGLVSVAGRFDMGFSMSPDGQYLAFGVAHESDTSQTQIYFSKRKGDSWSKPSTSWLPNNHNTFFPMFGPDGKDFYFSKGKPDGDTDLWVGERIGEKIYDTKALNNQVNSSKREAGHGRSLDGMFLFTSNRDDQQACCGDIYELKNEKVSKVESLNTTADEESLYLSPEGNFVIIQSWQNQYQSKHDLYISYRAINGQWTKPKRLPETINGKEIEQRPFVSADGKYLFFSRMSIEQKEEKVLYESDIYRVSTEKVFAPYVYNPQNVFKVKSNRRFFQSINTFRHATERLFNLKVTMPDGSPLPKPFDYYPERRSLVGKLIDGKAMTIMITATDKDGQSTSYNIELIPD